MNILRIKIDQGIVVNESKRELGEFFRNKDGEILLELHPDEEIIDCFLKAEHVSQEMEKIFIDDTLEITKLLEARLKLSYAYSDIASLSSKYEGLFEQAYHQRKNAEAERFLYYKNTTAKGSDNAAKAFSVIATANEQEKETEFKRLYKKSKAIAEGIEQKLNALAGIIKNAQNDRDRNG